MAAARWEITFVLLTGLGNFLLAGWLDRRLVYIAAACLFWTLFVVVRATAEPSVLAEWGFTSRNFGRSLKLLLPAGLLAMSGFLVYGMLAGSMVRNWHFLPVGLLYPFWGLVQQFLVVALVAGNIEKHSRIPQWGIVVLTALVFAAAHVPSLPLALAAFFLAAVTTSVYFRTRNLWALGLFHGWFATGLYYFALGQDPWKELISARLWP